MVDRAKLPETPVENEISVEQTIRLTALDRAIDWHKMNFSKTESIESIVATADKFVDFINSEESNGSDNSV